jgi:hypothetical protein
VVDIRVPFAVFDHSSDLRVVSLIAQERSLVAGSRREPNAR